MEAPEQQLDPNKFVCFSNIEPNFKVVSLLNGIPPFLYNNNTPLRIKEGYIIRNTSNMAKNLYMPVGFGRYCIFPCFTATPNEILLFVL